MGQAFRKLFDAFFGNTEMRVVMLGLDAAGKTTILYKLHIGEVLSTVPTIGSVDQEIVAVIVIHNGLEPLTLWERIACLTILATPFGLICVGKFPFLLTFGYHFLCYLYLFEDYCTLLFFMNFSVNIFRSPAGFNVEKVQYKNVIFTVWDVGGQEKLRPLWRHYFNNTDGLIYVVDSLDRERITKAKAEFQAIISDPFMLNSVILVFANKQDMKGAMSPMEVCEGLGLFDLKNRKWHIQGTCALRGDGLYEGLDWLAGTLKEMRAAGYSSVGTSSF
ncbi:hypothetical protein F8388_024579 [Cannabis sativa]|uniref:ADP-ribosylation factor n=1 Tax=Cannabis sativa TaxID=3483 RepID=A0A7J6GBF3_CANSA|nr:hypothetical protein F8388_024579 [Cannabis sativa]